MNPILAVVVGGLYAAGLYLMMRRSMVKLVLGVALLSNAANLLIFTASGLTKGQAPLIPEDAKVPVGIHADPVPQALILTAIVISFAVLAFATVLMGRAYRTIGTDDLDELRQTER